MLTLTFLGVGSAFAKRNFQSNALLEAWSSSPDEQSQPDDTLLIDFGATGPMALYALKMRPGFCYLDGGGCIRYSAIKRVFVTHQHADHIGGLEELAYLGRVAGARPQLISCARVLESLWSCSLSGGLGAMLGRRTTLSDFFDVQALPLPGETQAGRVALLDRYELHPFPTDHIQIERRFDWPSVGLLLRDRETSRTVFFSGDTRFDPEGFSKTWKQASVVFHEVQLEEHASPVHTLLSDLRSLPSAVKKKMILYHYSDDWDQPQFGQVSSEFSGFARPQHRYVLFE